MAMFADGNQAEITAALRKIGAMVRPLHMVYHGCPDLLVGWYGRNYLFEVSDRAASCPRIKKLFFGRWRGQVDVILSAEDALQKMDT